jgi:hypothetical protein
LCTDNASLAEAAAARVEGIIVGLRNFSVQLQQEQQTGSQHPATLLALPLQQLEPNRPNTLKRGEKAMYGGRSKAQRKKAKLAASEPAAAAGPPAFIEPFKAPPRRAVSSKRKTIAAVLSTRSGKENTVPAASMKPLQHATLQAAGTPVVSQGQPNMPQAAVCTAPLPAAMHNGQTAGFAQQTAITAGMAASAQRRPPQAMQLGSAGLIVQAPTPGDTAAPRLCAAAAAAVPPGAVAVFPRGAAAGPLGATAASAPLQGQALIDAAILAFGAAGLYPSDAGGS